LHESAVQMSPSPQSPSVTQQLGTAVFEHAPVCVSHVSVVQGLVSAQPRSLRQQATTAVCPQVLVFRSQTSVVQTEASLHCVSAKQQPVMFAFEHGGNGDLFVQKAPATTIGVLAQALREVFDRPSHPIVEIGTRHGEKAHESLLTREERAAAEDLEGYFRIPPDARDLNYTKFFDEGEERITHAGDYTSQNTTQLNLAETKAMLLKLPYIQATLKGEPATVES